MYGQKFVLQMFDPHFFYRFLLHSPVRICTCLLSVLPMPFSTSSSSAIALPSALLPYFFSSSLHLIIYFHHAFCHHSDTVFVCACGSPGAGRNHVTPRYYRHFNIINYVELSAESMQLIFSTVLTNFLSTFEDCVSSLTEGIVGASIDVYNAVLDTLNPTPSKPHYTFNMRDVSKVSSI